MFYCSVAQSVQGLQVSGQLSLEYRHFLNAPTDSRQLDHGQFSTAGELEFTWEDEQGEYQLGFVPFFRADGRDRERSHVDLREAYWRWFSGDLEVTAGLDRVFWGVTESRHLVNIVNQVDAVENVDEEDYLGQPMLALAWQKDWGRTEVFLLPYFRERTFPGVEGRLRTPLIVDTDGAQFESTDEESHLDIALRYSHYFGSWDLGLSWFSGTSREPLLLADAMGLSLVPFYSQINQLGIDLQYTGEAWLWKLEAIRREGQGKTFNALVGGFEYSFYQIFESDADLGLLGEYQYDGRDENAPATIAQNDIFLGTRLAMNDVQDTALLAGVILDLDDQTTAIRLEAERRLGQSWRVELELQIVTNADPDNIASGLANDDFITLSLKKYW